MRIKYLRENFRRDFSSSAAYQSAADRSGTSAAGNDPGGLPGAARRKMGASWAEVFSWRPVSVCGGGQHHRPQAQTAAAPPPASAPGQDRQTIPGGDGGQPPPPPTASGSGQRQHQDRRRKLCRTAATACKRAAPKGFMRTVSSLYPIYQRPPYSPPTAHARGPHYPCKIRSKHHQHSRQTISTGHSRHQCHRHSRHSPHSATPTEPPAQPTKPHSRQHHSRPARPARRPRRPARR